MRYYKLQVLLTFLALYKMCYTEVVWSQQIRILIFVTLAVFKFVLLNGKMFKKHVQNIFYIRLDISTSSKKSIYTFQYVRLIK